jgi:hypothetical protein
MPFTIAINPSANHAEVAIHGRISLAEARALMKQLVASKGLAPGPTGLVDTTDLNGVDLAGPDVRDIAELAARADALWTGGRWAIAAPRPVVFGLARVYHALRSGAPYEIGVFRTREEATSWLLGGAGPALR